VWREAERGETTIFTSFFTFTEVFKVKCELPGKPLSEEGDKGIVALLRQKWIIPVVVDERIATAARALLRYHPDCKKPADGIHLATAAILSVDELHTFDRSDLLKLNGKVHRADGAQLTICLPAPKPSSSADASPPDLELFDHPE